MVNQRNYYQVTICPQKLSRKSRLAHGMLLRTVKEFKSVGLDTVYNIEVEGDHSYILNGAVVHNCQAFSIAGLRGGLDDERGALTLKYVELANAIDDKRAESFLKPAVIVWENVPESCHRQITPSDVSLPDWLEKMRHLNRVIDLNQEK